MSAAQCALGNIGAAALPELETALLSGELMLREHAAQVLINMRWHDEWQHTPSDPLFDVLIASLNEGRNPRLRRNDVLSFLRWASAYGVPARLASLLDGSTTLGRFSAAVLLAPATSAAPVGLRALAVGVLVEHLRDNDIADDAVLATAALVEAGPAARPALEDAAASEDAQQRRLAALILRRIIDPGASYAQLPKDDPARITSTRHDPTTMSLDHAMWR